MKKTYSILLALAAAVSCANFDDAEYAEVRELAVSNPDALVVGETGGELPVLVYSNGAVTVTPLNDLGDWCTIDKYSFKGDDTLRVTFTPNAGFRRMAKLLLTLDGGVRKDTMRVKQNGVAPYLNCLAPFKNIDGQTGGLAEFELNTNIPLESLTHEISYFEGAKDWIDDVASDMNKLLAQASPNVTDNVSKAKIAVSYVDGWDVPFVLNLFVTESNREGKYGRRIEFADARAYAGKGKIEDDVFIEGVVVSDFSSKNMEENPSINYDKVDVTESERTAYVQSLDAAMGFRLKFTDPAANVLAKGTKVEMSLDGIEIVKEDNPVRYTIKGVAGENMVGSVSGGDYIVTKEKKISQLTDDDVYTFVTIPGTEFVQKNGSYANVYENYTLKSPLNQHLSGNNDRLDSWASLLVDTEGNGIYALVNMLCQWRRDGKGVPQGVGPVSGVIVHNTMSRYGDVGKYQIRVLDQTGFGQEVGGASTYKNFAEWDGDPYQYKYSQWKAIDPQYGDPGSGATRVDSKIPSDDIASGHAPNAILTIENKSNAAGASGYPISGGFSYTGLSVSDNGCDRGIDPVRKSMKLQLEIKGWYKWEDNKITGYNGLCMDFSTRDLSGEQMLFIYSFSVGTISAASSQNFPAHWCAEYSFDGGKTYTICKDNVTGGEYTHMRTMPWWDTTVAGVKYFTCTACGLGASQHAAILPAEVFGKDKVRIRLRPYDNVMAIFPIQWNGESETATVQHNTTVTGTVINIETLDIRYR